MIEVQVDMVLVRPDAAAFADFERHRTRDDVARREILRRRGIAFHETLALGVGEVTTLAARALGDQHARAIDAGRMELDEFHVLQGQAGEPHHAAAVAGAGVRRGGDRKSVVEGTRVSVRVYLGGRRRLKKNTKKDKTT